MKNLDLATYGVEEMNEVEMMEVDGGSWIRAAYEAVKGGIIYDGIKAAANLYIDACKAVIEGYENGVYGDSPVRSQR